MNRRSIFAAVAVVAFMACASTAPATTLTSPSGTTYTGTLKAQSEGTTELHNISTGLTIACTASTFAGQVEAHGPLATAGGKLTSFAIANCGTTHVKVLNAGALEIHATSEGHGTVTSTGLEITTQSTSLGISCTYRTNSTHIGLITGSASGGATLDLNSATVPRSGHSFFCGSSLQWTGSYSFTSPSTLLVDS